jgi:hypothetical protein
MRPQRFESATRRPLFWGEAGCIKGAGQMMPIFATGLGRVKTVRRATFGSRFIRKCVAPHPHLERAERVLDRLAATSSDHGTVGEKTRSDNQRSRARRTAAASSWLETGFWTRSTPGSSRPW